MASGGLAQAVCPDEHPLRARMQIRMPAKTFSSFTGIREHSTFTYREVVP
jgi:hypothetical protein